MFRIVGCLLLLSALGCSPWWAQAYKDCRHGDRQACAKYRAWASQHYRAAGDIWADGYARAQALRRAEQWQYREMFDTLGR